MSASVNKPKKSNKSADRKSLTVQNLSPADQKADEMEAYLFAFFTGNEEHPDDEQVYFALSKDGKIWKDLCKNHEPVLRSPLGEKGVRDPFIVRCVDGGFYLLATDLHKAVRGGSWDDATMHGSNEIIIWHSDNLVDWSEPWSVNLGSRISNNTGCVWAPEAVACKDPSGESACFVIWSSYVNSDRPDQDHLRIYASWTKDFKEFSDPFLWMDADEIILDAALLKGKDPQGKDCWWRAARADHEIIIEVSYDELPVGTWHRISNLQSLFNEPGYSGDLLEGPELFLYNKKDWKDLEVPLYGLMCDQFSRNLGYLPFQTTNLSSTDLACWERDPKVDYDQLKKRHGSILPITMEEYERLLNVFSPELL